MVGVARSRSFGASRCLVPAQATTSAVEGSMVQVSNATPPVTSELAVKLAHLKDAYDAQLISREEYDAKRKALIDNL